MNLNDERRRELTLFAEAVTSGQVDTLEHVWTELGGLLGLFFLIVPQFGRDAYCEAGGNGHVGVLDWLERNGIPGNRKDVALSGAHFGHIPVVEWARARRLRWSIDLCAAAVLGGQLPMLQWLREQGCPWNALVIRFAREKGHDDIEQWARENGCPEP